MGSQMEHHMSRVAIVTESDKNLLMFLSSYPKGISRAFVQEQIRLGHSSFHLVMARCIASKWIQFKELTTVGNPHIIKLTKAGKAMVKGLSA